MSVKKLKYTKLLFKCYLGFEILKFQFFSGDEMEHFPLSSFQFVLQQ